MPSVDENTSKNMVMCTGELSVDGPLIKPLADSAPPVSTEIEQLEEDEEELGQQSSALDDNDGSPPPVPLPLSCLLPLAPTPSGPSLPLPPHTDCLPDPPHWTDSHEQFRVLLIFANPTNTHPLRLQTEEKAIREALRGHPRIHIAVLLACTVDDLARHLMAEGGAGGGGGYHVIHFSGHADRSASLFRHTMRALHSSHDADLPSLKTAAVAKQVEAAVEALATRFEASLLSSSSPPDIFNGNSSNNSGHGGGFSGDDAAGTSHRRHYSSIHPTTSTSHHQAHATAQAHNTTSPGSNKFSSNSSSALSLSPSRAVKGLARALSPPPSTAAPSAHSFSVTSTHHRNRVEKDIHHPHPQRHGAPTHTNTGSRDDDYGHGDGDGGVASASSSPSGEGGRRVFTPASAASLLLVREVEVGKGGGHDSSSSGAGRRLVPHGSVHMPPHSGGSSGSYDGGGCGGACSSQLEHEVHIPRLVVQSRSRPCDTIEIEYRQRYSYQDIMDIGVGALAFESETHDTSSSGISFVSPPSLATLLAQHGGPSLQCVLLNVCGGHIQGDLLSSVVPFTVCFTGKVADKESLAFSRGFYDSIGMGSSVLQAFRAGSSRMDLHKLAAGIPDRLSRQSPLLTLLKNQRLLEASLRAAAGGTSCSSSSSSCSRQQQQQLFLGEASSEASRGREREAALEAQNQKFQQENKELRSLVAYGMELMKGKEQELKGLRQALEYVSRAAGLGSNDKKKIGNGGKRQNNVNSAIANTRGSSKSNNNSSIAHAKKASSPPPKKKKYVNVKSSGYGRRNAKISGSSAGVDANSSSKPNFVQRNKATIILKGKRAKESVQAEEQDGDASAAASKKQLPKRGYMAATQTSSSALSSHLVDKATHSSSSSSSSAKKHAHHQMGQKQHQKQQSAPATEEVLSGGAAAVPLPPAPPGPMPLLPPSPPAPLAVRTSILSGQNRARHTAAATASSSSSSPFSSRRSRGGDRLSMTLPQTTTTTRASPSRAKQLSSHSVQKAFPTTIASVKPKSWVKYYISENSRHSDGALHHTPEDRDRDKGLGKDKENGADKDRDRERTKRSRGASRSVLGAEQRDSLDHSAPPSTSPPPPLPARKAKQSQSQQSSSSSSSSSSLGWRKFLEERRASSSSSSRKPSSSFASAVPRFDSSSSASASGSGSGSGSGPFPEGQGQWR